ncbi:DUF3626 domain-containing protein [Nocardia sp. R16R-3T]
MSRLNSLISWLVTRISARALMRCTVELAQADDLDALYGHIEAQIHGPVRLYRDVAALVLDPNFRHTAIQDAAQHLPCPIEWHPGFRLSVDRLHRYPDFRGQQYVDLGVEIAVDGWLDPRIIGDAARTGRHDPQDVKKVWHYLARFGPRASPSPRPPEPRLWSEY